MKKILLSVFVVVSFIFYSIHQRGEETKVAIVARPPTVQATQSGDDSSPTIISPDPSPQPQTQPEPSTNSTSLYKNGTFTGDASDAYYGNIQVSALIQNGKITDVVFLQYPNDRRNSVEINRQAMPLLKQEAIKAQTGKVNIISGATDTSMAFIQSLTSALAKAK